MTELEIQKLMDCAIKARRKRLLLHIHISLLALLCYAKMVPFTKGAI